MLPKMSGVTRLEDSPPDRGLTPSWKPVPTLRHLHILHRLSPWPQTCNPGEPGLVGMDDRLCATTRPKLREQPIGVSLHRQVADELFLGDLGTGPRHPWPMPAPRAHAGGTAGLLAASGAPETTQVRSRGRHGGP